MVEPSNKQNREGLVVAAVLTVIGAGVLLSHPPGLPPGTLPDAAKTPGAIRGVTTSEVCARGAAGFARDVAESEKATVYKEYGIASHAPGEYEIDHLISLELGGSNDKANLWPQSYITHPWNAHVKDKLEDRLHAEVCSGIITLEQAQTEIRGDWTVAYRKRFGEPR